MSKRLRKKYISISSCICVECGKSFPIPRTHNAREKGHIKTLWCPFCKKYTQHLEIREFDYLNYKKEGNIN